MDAKYTPGPWDASRDGTPDYAPQYTVYAEATGDRVATAFGAEANASLIAAAPDMYEALARITEYYNSFGVRSYALDRANAVLAKADGR